MQTHTRTAARPAESIAEQRESGTRDFDLEARGRIELPIKVLQTFALPLGDRASALDMISPSTAAASSKMRALAERPAGALICAE